MYWTSELAAYLEEAPWPATRNELIEYCVNTGGPPRVIMNLEEIEDDGTVFMNINDLWPDNPNQDEIFFGGDEDNF